MTEDDMDLFEEITGIMLIKDKNGNRINLLPDDEITLRYGMFYYEWSTKYGNMWSFEIIESVILLAHSIPRRDLEEMLR